MTLHYLTFLEFFFQLCFNDSNRGRVGGKVVAMTEDEVLDCAL